MKNFLLLTLLFPILLISLSLRAELRVPHYDRSCTSGPVNFYELVVHEKKGTMSLRDKKKHIRKDTAPADPIAEPGVTNSTLVRVDDVYDFHSHIKTDYRYHLRTYFDRNINLKDKRADSYRCTVTAEDISENAEKNNLTLRSLVYKPTGELYSGTFCKQNSDDTDVGFFAKVVNDLSGDSDKPSMACITMTRDVCAKMYNNNIFKKFESCVDAKEKLESIVKNTPEYIIKSLSMDGRAQYDVDEQSTIVKALKNIYKNDSEKLKLTQNYSFYKKASDGKKIKKAGYKLFHPNQWLQNGKLAVNPRDACHVMRVGAGMCSWINSSENRSRARGTKSSTTSHKKSGAR